MAILPGTPANRRDGPANTAFASREESRYVWRGHENALPDGNAIACADVRQGDWKLNSRRKCDQATDSKALSVLSEKPIASTGTFRRLA
jgi:hypothetical protein